MAKKKRQPGIFKRGLLCATFALAAVLPFAAVVNAAPDCPDAIPPDTATAEQLYVFNEQAVARPVCADDFGGRWQSMLSRYEYMTDDTAEAQAYREYLSQFDNLRGRDMRYMVWDVTYRVNKDIHYTHDNTRAGNPDNRAEDYWQSPVETAQLKSGDCEDYAIEKYFILRYLGVPAERMYIATVNIDGDTDGVNHAVLLVNMAPEGREFAPGDGSDYVILDSNNNVLVQTTDSNFSVYGIRNENGYWNPPDPAHVAAVKVALQTPPGTTISSVVPKNNPQGPAPT